MLSSDPVVRSAVGGNGKPYFGLTGTELNIWVTVACTTAMALFGNLFHEVNVLGRGYANNFAHNRL